MRHHNYAVWWSPDDQAYLATESGLPAGTIHGATPVDALTQAIAVADEWHEAGYVAHEPGTPWNARGVRALRRSLDLSQDEFARLLNVSLATVRAWEQGKREPAGPSIRLLDLVAAAPGIARQWQHASALHAT